jgi:hypothetical protein
VTAYLPAIGVDFDGVIHAYSQGWKDGTIYDPPLPGSIDSLHFLGQRYALFVFTSREVEQVTSWLAALDLNVAADGPPWPTFWNHPGQILVTNRKLPAVAYIDDRAIRFIDWSHTLAEIAVLEQPVTVMLGCTCPWNNGYHPPGRYGHHIGCPVLVGEHSPDDGCPRPTAMTASNIGHVNPEVIS